MERAFARHQVAAAGGRRRPELSAKDAVGKSFADIEKFE